MAVAHEAIQLAVRARALTLSVVTTGSLTLSTVGSTYTRASGSFITDGFRVGMEVTPAVFSDTTRRIVTRVEALTLTVDSAPTTQTAVAGASLSVGLPEIRVWENLTTAPEGDRWHVVEAYLPGGVEQVTTGRAGQLEVTPLYVLDCYAPANTGIGALAVMADALCAHFPSQLALALANGDTVRVRGRPAPTRSALTRPTPGQARVTVTIPLRLRTANPV